MRATTGLAICTLALCGTGTGRARAQFPAIVDLDLLTPDEGRRVNGLYEAALLGVRVAGGGDFNADGVVDLLVGAPGPFSLLDPPPNEAYAFFGDRNLLPDPDVLLAGLDGLTGFVVPGEYLLEQMGASVSNARDVNADGVDDLIVGARSAGIYGAGRAYVLFGEPGIAPTGTFDVATLDGTNGFIIQGPADGDVLGDAVAGVGDLNADGYNDVAVGAPGSDPHGKSAAGRVYVLFGYPNIGSSALVDPSALDGEVGFAINGIVPGDLAGSVVEGAGDVNGDGWDDLLMTAPYALPDDDGREAGQAYVIFGRPQVGGIGVFELADLDGTNGFRVDGLGYYEHGRLATAACVGDVNDDGIDDIALGASTEAYVIFGRPGLGASGSFDLTTLDGTNGFRVPLPYRWTSRPSSRVDINHDGIDDLVIGHPIADAAAGGRVYVFYGHSALGSAGLLDPTALDGANGFVIVGPLYSHTGGAVAGAGDVNDDGVEDLVIGSPRYRVVPYLRDFGRFDVLFGRRKFALGDFDQDGDVDMSDFSRFTQCYNGSSRPPAADCPEGLDADLDRDADVDLDDFSIFAANYTGSL